MDSDDVTNLKLKINQFIWENAKDETNLYEAERMACKILDILMPDWRKAE